MRLASSGGGVSSPPAGGASADVRSGLADAGLVLCSHRPVLPAVFDALGLEDPQLEPGALLVAHLRKGAVVATETHQIH